MDGSKTKSKPVRASLSTNNCFQGLNFNKPLIQEQPQPKLTSLNVTKAIGKQLLEQINSQIGEAEEIVTESHRVEYTKPWQRRQINDRIVRKIEKKERKVPEAPKNDDVSSESDSLRDPHELPGDQNDQVEKEKKINQVQEKLNEAGKKIPVSQERAVRIKNYERLFKYKIYEAYKPTNLAQSRDYLRFLTEPSNNESQDKFLSADTPEHILAYCNEVIKTPMPSGIN